MKKFIIILLLLTTIIVFRERIENTIIMWMISDYLSAF